MRREGGKMARKALREMYILENQSNKGYTTAHHTFNDLQKELNRHPGSIGLVSHWREYDVTWMLIDRFSLTSSANTVASN